MEERIQKIISAAGVTSRRAAEELIAEGRVRVNGTVVTELGSKADPSKDHIKVDGKLINPKQPPTYIMLNKPAGFVTTMSDPEGRPTVQDLLKGVKIRVYPVGRLDYNTEGLLLLTNDGDFAHLITHPKHEFPKTYLAKIKGVLEDGAIAALEAGVFLKDGKTAPAKIKKIRKEESNSWIEITIHEGRKRQVRRMFDHMGHSVIRLKRVKTGGITLGDLPEGRMRYLTPEEVGILRAAAEKTDVGGKTVRVYKPEVKKQKTEVRELKGPGSGVQMKGKRE
jgi:23S rRNA pseudouridine2605 synthase